MFWRIFVGTVIRCWYENSLLWQDWCLATVFFTSLGFFYWFKSEIKGIDTVLGLFLSKCKSGDEYYTIVQVRLSTLTQDLDSLLVCVRFSQGENVRHFWKYYNFFKKTMNRLYFTSLGLSLFKKLSRAFFLVKKGICILSNHNTSNLLI